MQESEEEGKKLKMPSSSETFHSHGQIQKISQDGSKSTYMIILSKDCFKDAGLIGNASNFFTNSTTTTSKNKLSNDVDKKFESPVESDSNLKRRFHPLPKDVKLNLSNINDNEYDSNQSSSSVFLQESGFYEEPEKRCTVSYREKSKMNSYIIPSPLSGKQSHKTSDSKQESEDKSSAVRKIVLVTPTPGDDGNTSVLKRSIAYTNDAVPVVNKTDFPFNTPASLLPKNNPKAVPTFSNISPINQQYYKPTNSAFVPISPMGICTTSIGPYTSTPVSSEGSSKQLTNRSQSATHRPVYIIPSPFARPSSTQKNFVDKNYVHTDTNSSNLNNSSGFISGSSSLDTPNSSQSLNDSKQSSRECQGRTARVVEVNDGSGGVVVSLDDDDDIESLDLGLESVSSSQESTDAADKGMIGSLVFYKCKVLKVILPLNESI